MPDRDREIQEALAAGDRALNSLRAARELLNGARGWGVVDLLGGGLLSTYFKHANMKEARAQLEQARADLLHFRYELNDVAAIDGPDLRTDDFLGFADYFFDGFLADVMMQSRINQARANVEQAIGQVEGVMARLRAQR